MDEKRYHHGGLERELIEKGIQLLAREGYEGFSMRKLAALCGVSHAAPYKHFKGREEIVLAISQKIAEEFTSALRQAAESQPADLRGQVAALCACYVRFMTEHPDYFRIVFMTPHGRPLEIAVDGAVLTGRHPLAIAEQVAEAYFRPALGDGWRTRFFSLWSLTHGYTLMQVSGTIAVQGDPLTLLQPMLDSLL